jgi:colanic acid biosynthesis glycosyl transferase WcaI
LAVPRALFIPCDVILAMTDPPFEGIVGALVSMLKRRPYVYNIRDLYPDMAVAGEIIPPRFLARIWEKLHRWALRHVTRVIVLGGDMRNRIIAKGVRPERVDVVRDGADIPSRNSPRPHIDEEVVRTIRASDSFVLLHAGNLGFYGAWETLVRSARDLQKDGAALVFVGDGAQREQIQALANGAQNVRFLPFFPASKIPSVLAAADAHVITVKRGLEGVVVPSKMYGILAAGKPIVVVAPQETDAASLGAEFGFAVSADPDRPEDVVSVVQSLARHPEKLRDMELRALAVAPDYDRVNQLQKFIQIIEEVSTA